MDMFNTDLQKSPNLCMHTTTMTSPPNLRVHLSPELTRAEILQEQTNLNLFWSSLFKLCFPQSLFPILRPEFQDAFIPVCLGFPYLGNLKLLSTFLAFPAFYLFPTTSSSLGNLDFSSKI